VRLLSQLSEYQKRINDQISRCSFGGPPRLSAACLYALNNGGKRFRPAIVYMVAEALGKASVDDAALGVEFFHTASLIADDLPCMDNDSMRRGQPSLHRAFDEKTALLATYALIAEGYDRIRRSASPEVLSDVIEQASKGTGLLGATSGQYLDLNPTSVDEEGLLEVLYLKTGALFELSFVLGWLIGGGDLHLKERVQEAAYHFGLAFQIADDIDDYDQDEGRLYNYARMVGKGRARERVVKELEETEAALEELQIPSLYQLTDLLVF